MREQSAGPGQAPAPRLRRQAAGLRPNAARLDEPASAQAILGSLRRRKLWLLACALLIPALALVAIRHLTPRYTATGTLIYDPNEYKPRELQSILRVDPTTEAVMASQAEVLGGLQTVEQMARQLDLFSRAEFNPALRPVPWPARLLHLALDRLHLRQAARPAAPGQESSRDAVLLAAQQAVQVRTVNASRVLEVSFTSEDPHLAASAVNALMDVYVRNQLTAKFRAVQRAQDWLESRAQALRGEVRAAEDRVAAYRNRQGLVRGMHAGLDAEQISNLTEGLARARSELAAAQGRLDAARNGAGAEAEAAVAPSVVQEREQEDQLTAQLHSLLTRLGPNHPDVRAVQRQLDQVRRSVAAAEGRVVSATEAEVRAAGARVEALEHDVAKAQAQSESRAEAQVPLNAMERDLDASRTLLQSVLERLQETAQQAAVESPDAREVSLALAPAEPSFPRTGPLLAAAVAFGVLFGLMVVYVLELSDTTLKSGEDVRAWLGLPCFALVPFVGRRARGWLRIEEYAAHKPLTPFAEQLRALRAGLWFGPERPRTVAITAARPAEGKTTITLALARSAAMAGERVVAVDCDIRSPSFPDRLGGAAEPGLADCLRGVARLEEVIQKDPLTNMAYIPAGTAGPDTFGLFMSEAMGQVLQALRHEYQLVLLDAPPAHAMTDTRAIAQIADATLVCARWRRTPRAVVQNAIELLEAANASVAGVALTRVDARTHRRSGYADAEACHPRYGRYFRT